jgi:hypothetical protein
MLQARDQARFAGPLGIHHLEGHAPVKLRIAGGVDHAQPAAANLFLQLVARAGKVGKVHHFAQVTEYRIAQLHRRRISSRSSRSPEVTPRRRSVTKPRSLRRAHAR